MKSLFARLQAPGLAVDLPSGLGLSTTVTFQAILEDDGSDSAATFAYSATNAVVVTFQ